MAKGLVVAFGPVADPNGGYGIAILDAKDHSEADDLISADPALQG